MKIAHFLAAAVLLVFAWPTLAPAQPKPNPDHAEVKRVALSQSALRPGDKLKLAVEVEIKKGFHAQSRTPTDPNAIKFNLKLDAIEGLTFGETEYPAGHDEEYEKLGPLNVYTGTIVVRVPVEVKADVKPGDVKISGTLRYQICDDSVCFPPVNDKFSVESKFVPAETKVELNEPDLFKEDGEQKEKEPEKKQSIGAAAAATPPTTPGKIFGRELASDALLLPFAGAFLVGIIFNVMPCVLPVVPLKIIGFAQAAEHSRAKSLLFGTVFSVGLVASFGVLALLIVVLRALDWGELFTKWWFILPMVTVLVLMALSMFGLFSVNVPGRLANFTPRHDTLVGNFLFGVLTAALSTPCTFGMFVGLLAWALTQPAVIGVSLIMMVGVGMAFPYFVLSAFPEVARKFPRAGAGGELVKQFMGFLLLATAVYFASPLILYVATMETVWWWIFGSVGAGALFLLVRGMMVSKTMVGRIAAVLVAVLILVPSVYAVRLLTAKPFEWQAFTPEALEQARAQGKVVLVEFTATWCGNCHWVEAFVIKSRTIVKTVDDHGVVMLKADVTKDDAPGWPLLNKLSPAGAIPLTAVYPRGAQQPVQLNGIYEKSELKRVIEEASREQVASR